jgi:3',5'-nucleoside bisphosphate phosphatase
VQEAGIDTFAVADHDTVAALPEIIRLAAAAGLTCIPALEITAIHEARDVHVLGYFVNPDDRSLLAFLEASRADRLRRARVMCDRLAAMGAPVDVDDLLTRAGGANSGKSIARPIVARALLEAGHVASIQEAFDLFLAEGRPAYCPRVGASPAEVVRVIGAAGGVASFAHPGTTRRDGLIEALVEEGLTALECFHSEHDEEMTGRYLALARRCGLAVTGGSDFHGPSTRRAGQFGRVHLPTADYHAFLARAGRVTGRRL